MVIPRNINCSICDAAYFVRVGVGGDSYQPHSFDCLECFQPMTIAVRASPPNAHIESVENVIIDSEINDEIGTVINLHPNSAFSAEQYHERQFFPSLITLEMVTPHLRMRPGKLQDYVAQFDIPNAPTLWGTVKAILKLSDKQDKQKVMEKQISSYAHQRKKYIPESQFNNYFEVVYDFFDYLFYPKINALSDPIMDILDKLQEDDKLDDFINFYQTHLKKENENRYLSTFSSYLKHRNQFSQLLTHARISSDDVDDKMVGSKGFEEIKLYYGEVYEALTSNFSILACINNLIHGRKFDEFERMNLNKYLKDVEKSKRHNPFSQTDYLKDFVECIESTLRNGSHHASIWREGEVVMYRSGGAGTIRDVSYSRYLHMCNVLTISLAALFIIELHIQKYRY